MDRKTIKFRISQDGTVTEEVTGVKGSQCLNLTEKIESKLGKVQWRKETPDYYQQVSTTENVTLHQHQDQN